MTRTVDAKALRQRLDRICSRVQWSDLKSIAHDALAALDACEAERDEARRERDHAREAVEAGVQDAIRLRAEGAADHELAEAAAAYCDAIGHENAGPALGEEHHKRSEERRHWERRMHDLALARRQRENGGQR